MTKTKLITTLALAFVFLFAQVGNVFAASTQLDETPITGTIDTIVVESADGVTTVVVTLLDGQSFNLSVETAASLGLLVLDPVTGEPVLDPVTGLPTVDESQLGQPIEIDPTTVIPDEAEEGEAVHPISALLAAFFGEEASIIDGYHEDGFGFGVIAQALWMSKNLEGDASAAGLILEAKQTGDYSAFTLPDGTVPTNWGQFKKAVSEKKNNLGVVVSGHADDDSTTPANGNGNGGGNGNGNGGGNGNGKGNGKGGGNGNGNGHNKP